MRIGISKPSRFALMAMVLASALGPFVTATAEPKPTDPQPELFFSDLGGERAWQAGGEAVVFVKNRADQWYRAQMAETCMKLDTSKGIKFLTEFDPVTEQKSSRVVVDRHICRVISLTKVDSPDSAKQ